MPKGHYDRRVGSHSLAIVRKFFPDVKSVKDADSNINVEVTKQDDKVAQKSDHAGCAMAVACKRSMNLDGVIVSRSTAYLIKGRKATRYKVPESVSREIVSFDRGGSFMPGEYALDAPTKYNRLGAELGSSTHTGTGKRIRKMHLTAGVRVALAGPGSSRGAL